MGRFPRISHTRMWLQGHLVAIILQEQSLDYAKKKNPTLHFLDTLSYLLFESYA